jgi:hypothetical protein
VRKELVVTRAKYQGGGNRYRLMASAAQLKIDAVLMLERDLLVVVRDLDYSRL